MTLFFETRIKFLFCTRGVRDILVLDSIALRYVYYILIGCLLIPREDQIKINVVYFYNYIFYNIIMNIQYTKFKNRMLLAHLPTNQSVNPFHTKFYYVKDGIHSIS